MSYSCTSQEFTWNITFDGGRVSLNYVRQTSKAVGRLWLKLEGERTMIAFIQFDHNQSVMQGWCRTTFLVQILNCLLNEIFHDLK